ncbi:hypothetical protein PUN28_014031 [Cardiocondyla obscurior]|uniref:Uncharacterized protein n=1 Tax=Cardiocondyla obscurior TaxID=286306 RepID=A0AAW2F7D4_9HYME
MTEKLKTKRHLSISEFFDAEALKTLAKYQGLGKVTWWDVQSTVPANSAVENGTHYKKGVATKLAEAAYINPEKIRYEPPPSRVFEANLPVAARSEFFSDLKKFPFFDWFTACQSNNRNFFLVPRKSATSHHCHH